ncbi:unnamed protein product (mitochondrion) [Plasmodiophora brassicae]|uniref:Uncharacterized protein n=1 Tax=Plasmodiophora brassicae TaxID=37360 RepID=A0A3P3Y764_PLABS|nr:unnamed protein product [Plasmodiophora brassicae]
MAMNGCSIFGRGRWTDVDRARKPEFVHQVTSRCCSIPQRDPIYCIIGGEENQFVKNENNATHRRRSYGRHVACQRTSPGSRATSLLGIRGTTNLVHNWSSCARYESRIMGS